MRINTNENNVVIDCDNTLVIHDLTRPDVAALPTIAFDYYGVPKTLAPHLAHVELVKSYRHRGFHVTVWSNNGWQWAKQVVEKLGLTDYVDEVQSKPIKHVDDDTKLENIVGGRVFIPHPGHQ